jgi:ABC-type Zn uptake system ZnuABC Zn-binding protein ZnuA
MISPMPRIGPRRCNNLMRGLASLVWLALLAACGAAPGSPGNQMAVTPADTIAISSLKPLPARTGPLPVMATTSLIGDVLKIVGGSDVQVSVLFPIGSDPHEYELTPGDVRQIAQSPVVFMNGFGYEANLQRNLASLGGSVTLVSISEGIQPLAFGASTLPPGGQVTSGVDPHVWFDPANVEVWAHNAAEALSRLDPQRQNDYQARASAYIIQLHALDEWIQGQVNTVPVSARLLVTDHESLGYFAARYGFTIIGAVIPAYSTLSEPSAQELSQLEIAIEHSRARAVFVGINLNASLAQQVAADTGIAMVPLYAESLSPPGGPAPDYLSFMRYNVSAIVAALR